MTTDPEQPIRVRRAAWPADQSALRQLREQVFVREQGVPAALEWDGLDAGAEHFLAEDGDGQAIGAARLLPSGQIGRMAVLPAYRGQGAGTRLLALAVEIARREKGLEPWLNAQTSAEGFYRRLGFEAEGKVFLEAGIPHRRMHWRDTSP